MSSIRERFLLIFVLELTSIGVVEGRDKRVVRRVLRSWSNLLQGEGLTSPSSSVI